MKLWSYWLRCAMLAALAASVGCSMFGDSDKDDGKDKDKSSKSKDWEKSDSKDKDWDKSKGDKKDKGDWDKAGKGGATVTAVPRNDEWWMKRHQSINENAKSRPRVIFIGDSITQGWEGAGKGAWASHFAPRGAVNMGIGGDQTQHVLWRLDNGNLEGIRPEVAVVMIGTNNSKDFSAEEIAEGIKAIVHKLHERLPKTKIILLGVFPRGQKPDATRAKLAEVNRMISKLDDAKGVKFLDIGDKFLEADGSISKEIMPDYLHLSEAGYERWAEALEPTLKMMLGEKSGKGKGDGKPMKKDRKKKDKE